MDIAKTYKSYLTITAIAWAVCLVLLATAYMILLKPQVICKRRHDKALTEKQQKYESAQRAANEQTKIEDDGNAFSWLVTYTIIREKPAE